MIFIAIILSILISFLVSLVMMKWHIWNANKLLNKYFDIEQSNIEKFSKSILDKLK